MINLGPYSGKGLPNVSTGYSPAQKVMDAIMVLLMLITIIFTFLFSDADRGIKQYMPALICFICTAIFLWMVRLPVRFINFPVRVNEKNIHAQYLLATYLTRIAGIEVNIFFLVGMLDNSTTIEMKITYLPHFFIILLAITLIIYYVLARRYR